MHRLIALYHQPEDKHKFRTHLSAVHLPIVARFPGLRAMRVGFDLSAGDNTSPYFAIVECDFDDEDALQNALASPAGAESAADIPNYAAAGVTIYTYDVAPFPL